jgi:hypothetical protein
VGWSIESSYILLFGVIAWDDWQRKSVVGKEGAFLQDARTGNRCSLRLARANIDY